MHIVDRRQRALRGTEIGVNFYILFQSIINITTQLGRQDMMLFSTVIFTEIGSKTHKQYINENR